MADDAPNSRRFHDADAADADKLRDRLGQLERELTVLRREVDGPERTRARLPATPFRVLSVQVGDDFYGVFIDTVIEIIRYVRLTQVADLPHGLVGAVNVRGSIHGVVDARVRFGVRHGAPRLGTSIVLTRVRNAVVGVLVDRVLDVVEIQESQLEVSSGPLSANTAIMAMATVAGSVLQLVDVDQLLRPGVLAAVREVLESIAPAEPPLEGSSGKTQ